jgi:hypothetical protein
MDFELHPDAGRQILDAVRRAAREAGLTPTRPSAAGGSWGKAARLEGVERDPRAADQVLSPRSTRGATRA